MIAAGRAPDATIVIVSKNRRDDLRPAIASALRQTAAVEVMVIDDGSTDGTAQMVRAEFPQARLIRHEDSRGYIVRRNEGAREASGGIIFSIDDDAEFSSSQTVAQTIREFEDERIGAVAIPCIEPRKGGAVFQRAPDAASVWVTDVFIGTAHAVRRDVFLRLGGYRERLIHQGEERDYCLRLLNSGRVVRLGLADAITHFESPKRDMRRMDYYGRRNDVLFAWHHVPMPAFAPHLLGTLMNGLRAAWLTRRPLHMLRGTTAGLAECVRAVADRRPVGPSLYRLHRQLKKSGPVRLNDVAAMLPPLS